MWIVFAQNVAIMCQVLLLLHMKLICVFGLLDLDISAHSLEECLSTC